MSCSQWKGLAIDYNPICVGSIDSTDTQPHDRALIRAQNSKYVPNYETKSDPNCTLFVARFHLDTNEDTIHKYFSKYGSIVSLRLVRDIVTGFSKRYAFIEYKDRKTAKRVYEEANSTIIDGKKILVDYELSRTMFGWKPRRLGGGFGGKKESGQLRFGCRDRPWKKPITLCTNDLHKDKSDSSKSLECYNDREERNVEMSRKEYRYPHNDHRYDNKKRSRSTV